MNIRKAQAEDLGRILEIYQYAREQMKRNGNPSQWGDARPSAQTVEEDIRNGNCYMLEQGGKCLGVFAFIIGEEPTYRFIEDGCWKNDMPYGTIHRIASSGEVKGIFGECLRYCSQQIANIRIDTHKDNRIMQHLLEKNGYTKCGIIYVEDGSPRIAYQL